MNPLLYILIIHDKYIVTIQYKLYKFVQIKSFIMMALSPEVYTHLHPQVLKGKIRFYENSDYCLATGW